MADTISQSVTAGLRATLERYGASYGVLDSGGRGIFWHETDQLIVPSQCPAIGVIDRGWSKSAPPTMGGLNADGTCISGIQQRVYTFDMPVHLVGDMTDPDGSAREMKRWLDGIAACVDDHCSLGGLHGYAEAQAGDPTDPFTLESQSFTAGQVTVTFNSWSADGSVAP